MMHGRTRAGAGRLMLGLGMAAVLLAADARSLRADEVSDMPDGEAAFPSGPDDFPEAPQAEDTGPEPERDGAGWIPSLAIGVDVQTQTFSGQVQSALRGFVNGERTFVSANPTLRGEIMSPVLFDIPGRPRLFAHAAWQWGWEVASDERFIAKEGNPGEVTIQQDEGGTAPPPQSYDGQGSEVDAEIENGWYAGLGVAFLVPVSNFDFRIKSSVDYYQESTSYSGLVRNVTCSIIRPNPPNPAERCVLNTQMIQAIDSPKVSKKLHALGPRLGVELDVAQRGQLALSIFMEGFVYWYLGERGVAFQGSDGTNTAFFSVESDPLVGGGSAGIRVSWRGF